MKTIYKYPLGLVSAQKAFEIEMPVGAEILTVQVQRDKACIWALVEYDAAKTEMRRFMLCGTGREVPKEALGGHVGMFQLHNGDLVWHLFAL